MERYTTIINLTVVAILLVILIASRRWRDDLGGESERAGCSFIG
jgi:hypothetical protein